MRSPRLLSIMFTVLACAGAVSCAAVLGFERLTTEDGIIIDGGIDAGDVGTIQLPPDAGPVEAGICGEIGIPPEPLDAAAAGGPQVLVALKLLDFGIDTDGGAGDVPGFNLDRACSVDIASSTCKTTVIQPTFERHVRDKNAAGLDNASFSLVKYIGTLSDILKAETLNEGIRDGKYGAVVRLTDWNATANDDDLQVEIFPAIGLLPRPDPDAGFSPDDQWVLDKRFLVAQNLEASNVKSDRAWVNGNTLVARFKEAYFPIFIDRDPKPFDIHITDVILTATITTVNGATSLTAATVAGRWKTADFLGQVRTIFVHETTGLHDNTLCEPVLAAQVVYGSVKKEVCDARDIRSDSKDSQNLGCDGVSAAMRIDTYPITNLGVFDASAPVPTRCDVDGAVPLGDDCAPN